MALKAVNPETIEKKLKLFLFGKPKVGKTTASLNFPKCYVFDAEKGTEQDEYVELMKKNGSKVFRSSDVEDVIEEIRALSTEKHDFQTILIDPITMLETDLVERAEKLYGEGDMRIWSYRDKKFKRLLNLLNRIDMNVIVTAHGKIEYGQNMVKLGTTFDGWKRWPYAFDLIIELEKVGEERRAIVKGSRIKTFKEGEPFTWSYEEFLKRYPIISKEVVTLPLATPEQVAELNSLLESVKLPEDTVDKWLLKAAVDKLEDMTSDAISKCIKFVRDKLPKD